MWYNLRKEALFFRRLYNNRNLLFAISFMSKKIFIFLVSGLAIVLGFSFALAAGPTLESGKNFTIPTGSSIIFLGSPNHNLTWTTYDGNAATASALAANPANCSAGYYPLGIAANGAVESCTLAATGGLTGSGTTNYMSKWTGASSLGNSTVFDNGTNVGIGTTAPGSKLSFGTFYDSAGTNPTAHIRLYESGTTVYGFGVQGGKLLLNANQSGGNIIFNAGTANDAPAERMRIAGTGNVGIGTISPSQKLEVAGNAHISGAITTASTITASSTITAAGGSSSNWASVNVGGAQSIQTAGSIYSYNSMCVGNNSGACNSTGGVVIGLVNASANVNIPSSGNVIFNNGSSVGIGTANPSLGKLTIDGGTGYAVYASTAGMGTAIYGGTTNSEAVGLYGQSLGTNSAGVVGSGIGYGVQGVSSSGYGIFGQSTTGYAGYFNGKGRFTGNLEALSFIYNSDRSLKKNIRTLDSSLGKILQLRGVSFDWKQDNKSSIGLVAQEVEKVYPELVSMNEEGFKSVQYGNLVAPLIEAIKEQQKKIDQLETKITILEMNQ